jgi:hypothetical protein
LPAADGGGSGGCGEITEEVKIFFGERVQEGHLRARLSPYHKW